MSVEHANTATHQTPQFGVACACPIRSDMRNAGTDEALYNALAERCLR